MIDKNKSLICKTIIFSSEKTGSNGTQYSKQALQDICDQLNSSKEIEITEGFDHNKVVGHVVSAKMDELGLNLIVKTEIYKDKESSISLDPIHDIQKIRKNINHSFTRRKKMNRYVVIRDMSAGNGETGEAWQETKIYNGEATLDEVMNWANDEQYIQYSRKRITITKPHENN